jgi:post-segregation antitoxin (ccd killing protein)
MVMAMKRRANVTIDETILEAARRLEINVSGVAERALAAAVERAAQSAAVASEIEVFETEGGIYDERELRRIRRLLAGVDEEIAGERRAG